MSARLNGGPHLMHASAVERTDIAVQHPVLAVHVVHCGAELRQPVGDVILAKRAPWPLALNQALQSAPSCILQDDAERSAPVRDVCAIEAHNVPMMHSCPIAYFCKQLSGLPTL